MFKNLSLTLILFFAFIWLASCKNDSQEAATQLNQEIMAVHDEVMPKMADINRLKRQISQYKDAVPDDNAELKDSLINAILLLAKMEDNMNDWMSNYQYPQPELTIEQTLQYLKGQRDTVKQLGQDIYMTMEIAQNLLKNKGNEE
jgi:hypothetical protein